MYEEYFGFSGPPFRLNPDPKFFFGSRSHNKAMAYLHYGLRQGEGFIVITGEIGAGKSMLIGHLIDQLDRSNVVAANLLTTNVEPDALLSHILSAFRIEPSGSGKSAELDAFEDFLYDQMNRGRRVLLIVDEAQNLPFRTIEELRMLSNMDYEGTPLFQVFLVGQPEFREKLSGANMEQFRQRVIASYHLEPLNAAETRDYVEHRLALVGWSNRPAFSADAFERIFEATGGVPRKINRLCNRILLHCSIERLDQIDAEVVSIVFADLKGENIEARAESTHTEKTAEPARPAAQPAGSPPPGPSAALPPARKLAPARPAGANPGSNMSALDRLRALREGAPLAEAGEESEPATLIDVKRAIEAITEAGPAALDPSRADQRAGQTPAADCGPGAGDASEVDALRLSIARSIDETRLELKTAHANVVALRRRLNDIQERSRNRRTRIAAGLSRAESLLSELRASA